MSGFTILDPVYEPGAVFVLDYEAPHAVDFDYSRGVPLGAVEPTRVRVKPRERLTDLIVGVHPFPVASRRLAETIGELEEKVELLPVEVLIGDATDTSYVILNPLDNVAALDRSRSDYEAAEGDPDVVIRVRRMRLDESRLFGRHFLRPVEDRLLLLASPELRSRIEAQQMTGFTFVDPADFRGEE